MLDHRQDKTEYLHQGVLLRARQTTVPTSIRQLHLLNHPQDHLRGECVSQCEPVLYDQQERALEKQGLIRLSELRLHTDQT